MSIKIKLKNRPLRRKVFESGGMDYEEARRISQERIGNESAEDLASSLGNGGMYAIGEDEGSFKTEMLDYVNWNGELVDIKGMIDFGKRCWDDLCAGPLGIFTEVYFKDVVGVTKHERLVKATVKFNADNDCASYILTKPIHTSQRLISKNKEDGSMTFEIPDIVINPELEKQFLSFGAGVRILSPSSLVKKMRKIFRQGLEKYEG